LDDPGAGRSGLCGCARPGSGDGCSIHLSLFT
jgi:hypothetical protein